MILKTMSPKDVAEIAAAVLASIGGGGAIVMGLSGFLGKMWAERALEKDRQEYNRLNAAFSQQLDLATRRVQAELDTITHLHKIRVESEFEKVRELWKKIAALRTAYHNLPAPGFRLVFPDKELQHKHEVEASIRFSKCLTELFEVWSGDMLSIPKNIADATETLVTLARLEEVYALQDPDPFAPGAMAGFDAQARAKFFEERANRLVTFVKGSKELEAMMRKHLQRDAEESQLVS